MDGADKRRPVILAVALAGLGRGQVQGDRRARRWDRQELASLTPTVDHVKQLADRGSDNTNSGVGL